MDLHTDGTYVKEKTDWLLMLKMEEENVQGGETAMLHLDDWEHLDSLTNDKVGKQNLYGVLQKVKMLITRWNILFFQKTKMENHKFLT